MIVSRKISVQAVTALLAAFAAAVLLAALPSPATALNWSLPATDLSDGPANNAYYPQVAVGSDGATTVVWRRNNDAGNWIVQARTRPAGSGTFGAAVNLSAAGQDAYFPQVAVGGDGATTVVWTRRNDGSNLIVQASTRPAGGAFGAAVNLSAAGQDADSPQVAAGVDGATTVVWRRKNDGVNYIVQTSTRPAGGAFGAAVNLSAAGQHAYYPQVAVAGDGVTIFVWKRWNGFNNIVRASIRSAAGVFSATDFTAAGQNADSPQVAAGVDGATTFVWRRKNDGVNYIVQATTRPAGGGFGAAVNLSAAGQDAYSPQVAAGTDGATTVVWSRNNASNNIVQASTRPAGSGTLFGGAENLSTAGQHADYAQVAVAVDGATTVVWQRSNGFNNIIQASTRPAGPGTFAGAVDLSALGQNAYYPQVAAVGVDGAATVVWQRDGPTYTRIQQSTTAYSLTLTKSGTGSGSVSSSPAGIDCGLVCSYSFSLSTSVTLTASPAAGSSFAGWSGSGCSGTSTCTVTMSAARAVNAAFTLVPPGHFNLTLLKSGTGRGTVTSSPAGINCGADCSENLLGGTSVTLTARPAAGSAFVGWSGSGCSGTSICTVTMSSGSAVDAKFMPSNLFTMRSIKVGRKAVISTVVLPGRGKLTQRVTRRSKAAAVLTVCKTSRKVTKAGTVKLTCKLNSRTRSALRKRSLRVNVKTTFTPTGGLLASKTKLIKLKRRH